MALQNCTAHRASTNRVQLVPVDRRDAERVDDDGEHADEGEEEVGRLVVAWPWAVESLGADLNLNVLKDTRDYSCF